MTTGNGNSIDVVVVGGGLIGLAVAYELARDGASVTVLDKDDFGEHQSTQNWGFARQQGRSPAELPLMVLANSLWQRLSEDLGEETGWIMGGNLAVFDTKEQEASYRAWLEVGLKAGIDTKFVDLEEIRHLIPGWTREVRGGIFAASDGQADPEAATAAYISACQRAGVVLRSNTPVIELISRNGQILGVQTPAGPIHAPDVVVAAGAWSRQLLQKAGISLPQNYIHGTVSLTTPHRRIASTTVWGPGFSFRQRNDGRFVCATGGGGLVDIGLDTVLQAAPFFGAFRKNWKRFALRPGRQIPHEIAGLFRGASPSSYGPPTARLDRRQPQRALHRLQETVGDLEGLSLERSWSGVIDSTPDGLPVIDHRLGLEGLTVATGFSGHGYGLVPAVGLVASELVQGKTPSEDLTAMRFGRFKDGNYVPPNAIL